jgi:hypothetical protein
VIGIPGQDRVHCGQAAQQAFAGLGRIGAVIPARLGLLSIRDAALMTPSLRFPRDTTIQRVPEHRDVIALPPLAVAAQASGWGKEQH